MSRWVCPWTRQPSRGRHPSRSTPNPLRPLVQVVSATLESEPVPAPEFATGSLFQPLPTPALTYARVSAAPATEPPAHGSCWAAWGTQEARHLNSGRESASAGRSGPDLRRLRRAAGSSASPTERLRHSRWKRARTRAIAPAAAQPPKNSAAASSHSLMTPASVRKATGHCSARAAAPAL